jgi:hypothetical protein
MIVRFAKGKQRALLNLTEFQLISYVGVKSVEGYFSAISAKGIEKLVEAL